jgi:hypothetical protein
VITAPGIYQISADEYHRDPCETASLSSSIAFKLISESPLHAKFSHPRLVADPVREESARMDIGSICHALMLEGENIAVVIDAENYRTKAAQEARDEARLAGKCPILAHEMVEIKAMMENCRTQLAELADPLLRRAFDPQCGSPEQALVWQESNGIWCRARLDWRMFTYPVILDYKTTARSAHPHAISRMAAGSGWLLQDAFYRRGFQAIFGQEIEPDMYFVVQETYCPYALSVFEVSPGDRALAEAQVDYAINTFGDCLKSGIWPGYSNRVERITSPPYVEQAWLEREQ